MVLGHQEPGSVGLRGRQTGVGVGRDALPPQGGAGRAQFSKATRHRRLTTRGCPAVGIRAQGRLRNGLWLQCCFCHVASHAPGGDVRGFKNGDVEGSCHGVKVRRSRRRELGWGRGRACHGGSWRGDVMRLADGHVIGLAGCGSTLLQGSGEGNTKLSSDLLVRGAAYDELTRWRFT